MKVLVTGSNGFIGKNLCVRLHEVAGYDVKGFNRENSIADLADLLSWADSVVHLAGVNRPIDIQEFKSGNTDLTQQLCHLIEKSGRPIPLIISSSTQAAIPNPYGESKLSAEAACEALAKKTENPVTIYRLPGVFGKWCRPNYNSVVATFCHNIANDLPIHINDVACAIDLVYIDDVVSELVRCLESTAVGLSRNEVAPVYKTTLGELATQIESFKECRKSLISERVGSGLVRALYATYVSYLPSSKFNYELPKYSDDRGVFVEMLKTIDSGQFSYFTAHPGVTRGGHYHHTKTEKFLVIRGSAMFRFRHLLTGELVNIYTCGDKPQVVDTIPGWAHDITNIGDEEMLVMLWANENFDRVSPDTIASRI